MVVIDKKIGYAIAIWVVKIAWTCWDLCKISQRSLDLKIGVFYVKRESLSALFPNENDWWCCFLYVGRNRLYG